MTPSGGEGPPLPAAGSSPAFVRCDAALGVSGLWVYGIFCDLFFYFFCFIDSARMPPRAHVVVTDRGFCTGMRHAGMQVCVCVRACVCV